MAGPILHLHLPSSMVRDIVNTYSYHIAGSPPSCPAFFVSFERFQAEMHKIIVDADNITSHILSCRENFSFSPQSKI